MTEVRATRDINKYHSATFTKKSNCRFTRYRHTATFALLAALGLLSSSIRITAGQSVPQSVCGNGRREKGEGCDDGNTDNGDG